MILYSTGYEGLSVNEFIDSLRAHSIDTLIDIRELPQSRIPGFSKKSLALELQKKGIEYIHQVSLGCPRDIRLDYRKDHDWVKYSIRFLDYMDVQKESLNWLIRKAEASTCCIMCFEEDFTHCHRSHIANLVAQKVGPSFTQIEIRSLETKAFEAVWVDKSNRLSTIGPEIDVEFLKEKIDLSC